MRTTNIHQLLKQHLSDNVRRINGASCCRSFKTRTMSIVWPDSFGRCRPVISCCDTSRCSLPGASSRFTPATSPNCTASSKAARSVAAITLDCRSYGCERTTPRQRGHEADHWAPSASTAYGGSTRCRRRYGTETKLRTASRRSRGPSSKTATLGIRIRRRGRSERWPRLRN